MYLLLFALKVGFWWILGRFKVGYFRKRRSPLGRFFFYFFVNWPQSAHCICRRPILGPSPCWKCLPALSTFPLTLKRHLSMLRRHEAVWLDPLKWSMNILWKWCTSMSKLSNSGYLYLPWLETDWSHCTGHAFSFKHYHSIDNKN